MDKFQEIINFRYACKRFNDKDITDKDMKTILEAGILAPSSCGIEQFHFISISSKESMQKIPAICFNQGTARTANKAVVVLAAKKNIAGPGSKNYEWHVSKRTEVLNKILEKKVDENFVRERFDTFCNKEEQDFLNWSKANAYLASMNIMNQAASLGIDSCPIEGFSQEKFDEDFPQFKENYEVAMIITLGYRDEMPQERIRLPFESMTTIV